MGDPLFTERGSCSYIADFNHFSLSFIIISGRFHRLMSGRCLVLKSTIFPEWYADRIMPWYHFVPVKVDYSDLYDSASLTLFSFLWIER